MSETSVPDFFDRFAMQRVDSATLDGVLADASSRLDVLFLWGRDCPNCDVAKRAMLLAGDRLHWDGVRWLHDNVYQDPPMAIRFGLHGIPAFFVFGGGRKLGRITAWPGIEPFVAAITQQLAARPQARG